MIKETINLFLSNPTWDVLLILFFFVSVFVYGLIVGRNKIIVLISASYPAALINEYLPCLPAGRRIQCGFLEDLNIFQNFFIHSFIFFILILFIYWVLNKSRFSHKELTKKTGQVIFLSFLNVGLWSNIVFGYVLKLSEEAVKLAPLTKLLFGSDLAHFSWLILPILVLFWLERK